MKYIILSCCLTCLFLVERGYTQVTISPELGISYLPFTLYPATLPEIKSNRVDFLLGISAQMLIHKNWYVNTRISYIDREDFKWVEVPIVYLGDTEYNHGDLNIDFSFLYSKYDFISLGIGPSLTRKINSTLSVKNNPHGSDYTYSVDRFYYSMNITMALNVNRYYLRIMYIRIFNGADNPYLRITGKNRLDVTFAVRIFGGK